MTNETHIITIIICADTSTNGKPVSFFHLNSGVNERLFFIGQEQDKRLQQLEEALKVTREEQSRLGRECADEAVQKKIADLFEDQLMCAICSEMIVQVIYTVSTGNIYSEYR